MSRDGYLPDGCSHAALDAAQPEDQPEPEPDPVEAWKDRARAAARRDGILNPGRQEEFMVGWLAEKLAMVEAQRDELEEKERQARDNWEAAH